LPGHKPAQLTNAATHANSSSVILDDQVFKDSSILTLMV